MRSPRHHAPLRRGFVLLELIVAIGILALVLSLGSAVEARGERQSSGRANADGQSSFQNLAAQYFLENRTAFESAMKDGTGADTLCLINVPSSGVGGTQANSTTLKTCAFDTTFLKAKNLWPTNLSTDEVDGRWVIILRLVYDSQTPAQPTGGVEAFVPLMRTDGTLSAVGVDAQKMDEALSAMRSLGGTGGVIPVGDAGMCANQRSSATYEACGNGWKVKLSDFIDSSQLAVFSNALPN